MGWRAGARHSLALGLARYKREPRFAAVTLPRLWWRYGSSPDPLARPGVRELAAFCVKTRSCAQSAMPRRVSVVACNDFKGGIFASVLPCAGRLSLPPR